MPPPTLEAFVGLGMAMRAHLRDLLHSRVRSWDAEAYLGLGTAEGSSKAGEGASMAGAFSNMRLVRLKGRAMREEAELLVCAVFTDGELRIFLSFGVKDL